MGKMIDADEFIRHTQNMINIARKQNDRTSEVFLSSTLMYFEQYLETFCKEKY